MASFTKGLNRDIDLKLRHLPLLLAKSVVLEVFHKLLSLSLAKSMSEWALLLQTKT